MPYPVEQAIDNVAAQSAHGPRFGTGLCKRKTREAYGVPSDGSVDATQAWSRTKYRLNVSGDKAPRGTLLWWTGGSEGHGHVAISDGKGGAWSVDVKRPGYWDHVPFADIARWAPKLHWAGVSQDIDRVRVVTTALIAPKVAPPKTTGVTKARALLIAEGIKAGPMRRLKIRAALAALPKW